MTTNVRRLLLVGVVLVGMAGAVSFLLPRMTSPSLAPVPRPLPRRLVRHVEPPKPPFSSEQLNQFLADARKAETIQDPLQRCLAYPDPPGLNWSKAVTTAYCRYELDPWVQPEEVRRLIEAGQAAELDRRFSQIMHAQLTQAGSQAALDRTFNIDFANGSDANRALIDAWKRQSPDSPFALAASGVSYVAMAQQARGSNYASKTSQDAFDSMDRLLERARTDLDAAVRRDPQVTPAYGAMIYAAALGSDGMYAVNAAKRGLAVDPANYSIYARLVWMAQPKWGGNVREMQNLIAASQRHVKENPLLLMLLSERTGGEAYVEDCPCTAAGDADIYKHLFAEPAPVGMLMSAGWAAKNRNAVALSVIYRSELLRFDPTKMDHRQGRAFDLPALGQADWALSEGNALIALAPQDENSYEVRGFAYEALGQTDHAVDDYEQALRINPDDTWGMIELGNLYIHATHDWDKAWAIANRLVQIHPEKPQGWMLRASIQKDQPRDGLNQTVSDFIARFGNDPAQQIWVQQMKALRGSAGAAASGH